MNHRHRAKRLGLTDHFTGGEWDALCSTFENKCVACGSPERITPDHVIPLSRKGDNTIDNLQPLCWKCNNAKRTNTIDYRNGIRIDRINAAVLPESKRAEPKPRKRRPYKPGGTPISNFRFTPTDKAMIAEIRNRCGFISDAAVIRHVIHELADKLEANFATNTST